MNKSSKSQKPPTSAKARVRILPMDAVAFLVSLTVFVWVSLAAYGSSGEPGLVAIQSDSGEFLYSFNSTGVYSFEGPIGNTVVEVDSTGARVISSPCRDQICVAAGHIAHTGEWTACLPNRIFVRIQAAETENFIDAGSH